MDTVKIRDRKNVRMIAHRGVSGLETENTLAAFIAAGNRGYYGIETDVHVTADGRFVIFHDDCTGRVADRNLEIEKSDYDQLRALKLKDAAGTFDRCDMKIPDLAEYIETCKHYEKQAVLEIKNLMKKAEIDRLYDIIQNIGWLDKTTFISFAYDNLAILRAKDPGVSVQFLCNECNTERLDQLAAAKMDIDIYFPRVSKAFTDAAHQRGIKVNCWTVNEPADAERLIEFGVDYITSNILE